MRKVNDFYFKKAKKDNYPARSVYKLDEVQQKYKFMKKGQRIIDFGCHPGSWSLYAAEVAGERGAVVGIDIQPTDFPSQKPNAEIHWLCYDVFAEDMVGLLREKWAGFHVVLSDMAPRTTGSQYADHQQSMRLVRRVLALSVDLLHENGTLYMKAFQGEDFPDVVQECKAFFQTVKVVKPKSSRKESREVFILGRGFRPKAMQK